MFIRRVIHKWNNFSQNLVIKVLPEKEPSHSEFVHDEELVRFYQCSELPQKVVTNQRNLASHVSTTHCCPLACPLSLVRTM